MNIEIHITTLQITNNEIDQFIRFCEDIEAKPIIIELSDGDIMQHPMISKRVKVADKLELERIMADLKQKFVKAGYTLARVKLEVHSEKAQEGKLFFPNFKGGYYEWHGKVYHDNLNEVYKIADLANVHISKNGLKGIENRRILTIRETRKKQYFLDKIAMAKNHFGRHGIEIASEESEYCIYDSNKSLDKGWIDTPEITDNEYLDMLSFEAFLRRAATLDMLFMLKGSILTRQFFAKKEDRIVQDIDYMYFGEVKDDAEFVYGKLTDWVEEVTNLSLPDDVVYRSFSENTFWREIDYAMNDDFPTTNTDLYCTVKNTVNPIVDLDISWGLPLNVPPATITYFPLEGEPFKIRYTTPISLQVSWKLHQSIVRPRLKDLVDLCYLLQDVELSEEEVRIAVREFMKECEKDKIDGGRLLQYINGTVRKFLTPNKGLLSRVFNVTETKSPLPNMGELDSEEIEFLKYTFPNYHLKYSSVTDILVEFEEVLRKNNFGKTIQEYITKSAG